MISLFVPYGPFLTTLTSVFASRVAALKAKMTISENIRNRSNQRVLREDNPLKMIYMIRPMR